MKKLLSALLLSIALMLAFTCATAAKDETQSAEFNKETSQQHILLPYEIKKPTEESFPVSKASLPATLQTIEDEAFEGTGLITLELPDTLITIGEKAFANILSLRSVRIPDSTKQIANSAFTGSNFVTITAAPNSFARTWARANGIPFAPIAVMHAGTGNIQISANAAHGKESYDTEPSGSACRMENHQQWRPFSDFKTEQYDSCIAFSISGRGPPTCG